VYTCQPSTFSSKNAITLAFGCSARFRPSCPEDDRNPERAISAGVWTAPPTAPLSGITECRDSHGAVYVASCLTGLATAGWWMQVGKDALIELY
jgi:hypothetical protein